MIISKITLFCTILLSVVNITFAQSTIFNAPSTDVVGQTGFYLEADFISHFDKEKNGGFQTFGIRGVYGVKKGLEVGSNVFFTKNGSGKPIEIQPNVKWQAFSTEKGVSIAIGATMFVPLNQAAGNRTSAMVYGNVSKKIDKANGLRLTTGIYSLAGAGKSVSSRTGAILGFEQPINKRLVILADWLSGKNRFGYATAGFSVFVTKKQTLFTGYNFGNSGRGNNSFSIYYSRIF
jgi:hypothetical protein